MGKFSTYKVPLRQLSEGEHSFDYHLDKEFFVNMENADIHGADLDVKLTVTHRHDLYALRFDIVGTIELLCDRCLDIMQLPIDTTYNITVKYGDEYNDESDELLIIPQGDNFLNVAYMIYDTVALQIPIKHVHPMGQCNRKMSALLRQHTPGNGPAGDSDEARLEADLIDEIDTIGDENIDDEIKPTDPRWDALRGLNPSEN